MTGPGKPAHQEESARLEESARSWQAARPRLVRVAYSITGSVAEAEDVVADCWLRLAAADVVDRVLDVEAWATVTVARAALDVLRSARVRREVYPGPWLPEPMLGASVAAVDPAGSDPAGLDPADRVSLDDSVSYALLVVLETLSPAERTAWVLHDLFAVPFAEVAVTVGRTPAAVRQLAARARAHVRASTPRVPVTPAEHRFAVRMFLQAAAGGDLAALIATLDPDVVLTSDGGGEVSAARHPVHGPERVARFVLGIMAKTPAGALVRLLDVNGDPGLAVFEDGALTSVAVFTAGVHGVSRVDIVRAPAKLAAAARQAAP